MAPFVSAHVVDSFEGGRGALTAKLFGIIPVARSRGPEADKGEALRGLAELPWRPFAFREAPGFNWEATAADKLRATYDDGKTRATFEFEVDAEGRVLGGTAASRPRSVGKSVVDTAWSGAFREYRMFDRMQVPTAAESRRGHQQNQAVTWVLGSYSSVPAWPLALAALMLYPVDCLTVAQHDVRERFPADALDAC